MELHHAIKYLFDRDCDEEMTEQKHRGRFSERFLDHG